MSKNSVEQQIQKIYKEVFEKVFNKTNMKKFAEGDTDSIAVKVTNLQNSKAYQEFAKKFAEELAKKGLHGTKGIWREYYEASKHAGNIALPKTFKEFEEQTMKKAIEENFKMIQSIPEEVLELTKRQYSETLMEEVAMGKKSRGEFEKELKAHGVTNAKVIARTESAKLQTFLIQEQALELDSVVYKWVASNDQRTRDSHKEMNGVIVFWNYNKPLRDGMRGHAGEFPNCRCSISPLFDEDDFTEPNYKVYNYNNDEIETYSRKQVIEMVEQGHI